MIIIHYDFVDGTEVSYAEGLLLQDNFTTCCLSFFSTDNDAVVVKNNGSYVSVKELLLNDSRYTTKEIRNEHNLEKMLKANAFVWQPKRELN